MINSGNEVQAHLAAVGCNGLPFQPQCVGCVALLLLWVICVTELNSVSAMTEMLIDGLLLFTCLE